jgi:hypothetical protein
MSEDNEYDNEWGTKKQKYYSMNKRENNSSESDSDFIEDEKEAIRLQKLRAAKIKKANILNEEEEEEISENEKKIKDKDKKEENELNKDISFKTVEIDTKKILENIETLKYNLEEIQTADDEIKIFEENKKLNSNLPKTLEYLKLYKKINVLNSANILFNIISTLNQKMTGHHPSIKNSAIMNFLLNKNSENNEEIQNNIEKILTNLEEKEKNEEENELNEEENELYEEEDEINDEEGEELDDNIMDIEENEEEEEEVEKIKNKKDKKNKNNKLLLKNPLLNKKAEKIKKPSFLSKKKKRDNDDNKEIDIKKNENFDINSDDEEDEDSFIKDQYKSFNKLNKEKELLDLKKEENEKKEIDMKNDFAIRKANKEVLKARGIYRKRKKYQGNAKLMNREKFYKKEKERRKMIKEYEGKPEVYMGEATGIRRDLVRSTKIH